MSDQQPIKIAIADDEVLFRKGICLLLQDYDFIEILFEAENGVELLDQLKTSNEFPDIILLDLNMPELNGVEVTKVLRKDYQDIHIIILSTHFSNGIIFNLIELGVASYLAKNTDPDMVIETIKQVHKNGFSYTPEIQKVIKESMGNKKKKSSIFFEVKLTKRELEVLQLICEQFTNSEIASKLFISPRTVEGHRNNLLTKLDCRNSAGLVAYAFQNNLVKIIPKGF